MCRIMYRLDRIFYYMAILVFGAIFVSCGGGSQTHSSNNTPYTPPPPSTTRSEIVALSPWKVMIGEKFVEGPRQIDIIGHNFSSGSVVLIDDEVVTSSFGGSTHMQAMIYEIDQTVAGSHRVQVRTNGLLSNSVFLEFYNPETGPDIFDAVNSYLLEEYIWPRKIEIMDMDGDSVDDVVALGTNFSSKIFILHGRRDGTLGTARIYELDGILDNMVCGDINGDSYNDIVITSSLEQETTILTNDGHGEFLKAEQLIGAFIGRKEILLEDMNGDVFKDLVLYTKDHDQVFVARNTGGFFEAPYSISEENHTSSEIPQSERSFSVIDLDNDGRKDVIYGAYNFALNQFEFRFLLQQADGQFLNFLPDLPTFTAETKSTISMIDYDKDTFPDLAVQRMDPSSGVILEIWRNLGNCTFNPVWSATINSSSGELLYDLAVGDFDADGHPDMAGENNGNHILYLWGNGAGEFLPEEVPSSVGINATSGDLNDDGIEDVIIGNIETTISVLFGRTGRFLPQPVFLSSGSFGRLSSADIDGNGFLDILVAGYDESPGTIFMNYGNGSFSSGTAVSQYANMITDLDGDGLAEMICNESPGIQILPGNGNPAYDGTPIDIELWTNGSNTYPSPFIVSNVQVLDMNQDGLMDIIANGSRAAYVLYGDGNYNFDAYRYGIDYFSAIGYFNKDSFPDVMDSQIYYGSNQGLVINAVGSVDIPFFRQEVVSGDFNGDGLSDVVNNNTVVYNRGNGLFYDQGILFGTGNSFGFGAVAVADFNGDDLTDIAVIEDTYLTLFTNDGNGKFQRSYFSPGITYFNLYGMDAHLIAEDFNNDSKLDLAITGEGNVTILFHK